MNQNPIDKSKDPGNGNQGIVAGAGRAKDDIHNAPNRLGDKSSATGIDLAQGVNFDPKSGGRTDISATTTEFSKGTITSGGQRSVNDMIRVTQDAQLDSGDVIAAGSKLRRSDTSPSDIPAAS